MKKKIYLPLMVLLLLGISCSLTKENKTYRSYIAGNWTLTNVSYQNNEGKFSSVLFKDAEEKCFNGSTWFFNGNNSTGYYNLPSNEGCAAGQRNIRWSVYDLNGIQELQFKFIDEKRKDLTDFGFRLKIAYLDENTMTLNSDVSVDGEPITVVYNFRKQ